MQVNVCRNHISIVCLLAITSLLLLPLQGFAQGVLLLSDSFNRIAGDPLNTPPQLSSWGDNDNAVGGGTIVQTYETSDPFTDAGNTGGAYVDGFQGSLAYAFAQIEYDWATNSSVLAGGGLKIEFDLQEGGVPSGHYAWWLGTADDTVDPNFFKTPPDGPGGTVPLLNSNADVGLLWRNNGGSGGSFDSGVAVNNTFPISPNLTLTDPNAIRIEIATTNFNSGTPGTMRLFIDGTHVDINGGAAGNDVAFAWDGQGKAYMGFSKNLAVGGGGIDNLRISTLQAVPTVTGDFNNDGQWNCTDINALTLAVASASTDLQYDMNGDGAITFADVTAANVGWLAVGGARNPAATGGDPFLIGDATLDGTVDGQDFIAWNTNKFVPGSAWCSGNFNGDNVIDGQDFIEWNTRKFTSSDSLSAVPEPTSLGLLAVGLLCWLAGRRRT